MVNLSFEDKAEILEQTGQSAMNLADTIRSTHKIKRNQPMFITFQLAFVNGEMYYGVVVPLIVGRRDTQLMYQPEIFQITQDEYLFLVSQSKKQQ